MTDLQLQKVSISATAVAASKKEFFSSWNSGHFSNIPEFDISSTLISHRASADVGTRVKINSFCTGDVISRFIIGIRRYWKDRKLRMII